MCEGQSNLDVPNSAASVEVLKLLTFLLAHPLFRLLSCIYPPRSNVLSLLLRKFCLYHTLCLRPSCLFHMDYSSSRRHSQTPLRCLCPGPSPTSPPCALQVHKCHVLYHKDPLTHWHGHRASTRTGTHPSCSLLCPDVWQTACALP